MLQPLHANTRTIPVSQCVRHPVDPRLRLLCRGREGAQEATWRLLRPRVDIYRLVTGVQPCIQPFLVDDHQTWRSQRSHRERTAQEGHQKPREQKGGESKGRWENGWQLFTGE